LSQSKERDHAYAADWSNLANPHIRIGVAATMP
jgi:hypothetical protein